MKKNSINVLNRFVIVIFVTVFIWSLWPLPENHQVYKVNGDYIDSSLFEDCPVLSGVVGAEIEFDYPEKIWRFEEEEIFLSVQPDETVIHEKDSSKVCDLTLEAELSVSGLHIEPGERIVVPFSGESRQNVKFTINPYIKDKIEGKLWISANAYDDKGMNIGHVPLFVIPLEIDVVSIFGMPPKIVRYGCLFGLILQFMIAFRKRLFG